MNRIEIIEKSLEKIISMDWIKKDPHIGLTFLAYSIEGDLRKAEDDQKKHDEINQMIDIMQKHFPGKVENFFKEGEI